MYRRLLTLGWLVAGLSPVTARAEQLVWRGHQPHARLVCPTLGKPMTDIVQITVNGYLADAFGWSLPTAIETERPGLYIAVGHEGNNPVIAQLVEQGLELKRDELGPEGFRLFTHEAGDRRFVIVTAKTPIGLKYGCQELVFFHMLATARGASVEWPMDVSRRPAFAYRGAYMLPCWAAHDSMNAWKRVLQFHSELTINRNWFWLAGFPLLEQYGGEYEGSDLADAWNVNGLIEVCHREGMKFYIGGGWYNWHHAKHAEGSLERGIAYYLDVLNLLPDADGIYLEPVGEGRDIDADTWKAHATAIQALTTRAWKRKPEMEFAVAIGKFNAPGYRKMLHEIDDERLYWWWCWGDPLRDNALSEHPLILRWHTIVRMSDFHGSNDPPRPEERELTGMVTSYDPGQGFGNPWNGWAKLGADHPREVHPHTMPLFSHQYRFRERCWDPTITPEAFAARLSRRLFDANMPDHAIELYLELADMCPNPAEALPSRIDELDAFVRQHAGKGTPRNRDTLARMAEAVEGVRTHRAKADEAR